MSDVLFKVAGEGGFDFTGFLRENGGYLPLLDDQVEIKTKMQSSGYEKRTLGQNQGGEIVLTFIADLDPDDLEDILNALNFTDTAEFEYWSWRHGGALRRALFKIKKDGIPAITTKRGISNDEFSVTLTQEGPAANVAATIVSAFPTAFVDKSGTWANETNGYADDEAYVTNPGVLNSNQVLYYSGFGFEIPETAKINYIEIEMKYKVSSTASHIKTAFITAYKNTERGVLWSSENEPLTDVVVTSRQCGKWTVAQLNSSDCQIKIGWKRMASTACTLSIDYVKMTVSYTEAG